LIGFLQEHGTWLGKYRVAVCGKVCQQPDVIQVASHYPNVSLLGFVDDIDQIYRRSQAAVSPVVGTGLKIKIVDALAKGKPVFASPSSLAGLPPGYEGCVFPIQRQVVSRILDHEENRRAAVHESRAYFATFGQRGDHEELLRLLRGRLPVRQDEVRDTKEQRQEGMVCLTKSRQNSSTGISIS
jgi:glycosyltransferase involved in cell wall biosynthesis